MDTLITKLKGLDYKNLFKRYCILTVTLLISALYYNLLLNPAKIVSGGTGGIATILYHTIGIEPAISIFIISAVMVVLSFIFLGVDQSLSALFIAIVYPLFVNLTSSLTLNIASSDRLIVTIAAGILSGLTSGIVLRIGFSTGGLNVISLILYKYKKISISLVDQLFGVVIVTTAGIFFGLNSVLYAIIYIYVGRLIIDKILLGISMAKSIYVISRSPEQVSDVIQNVLGEKMTIFDVKGPNIKNQKLIMTIVPTSKYFEIKGLIKEIDPKAFIVVTDSYEVKYGKKKLVKEI